MSSAPIFFQFQSESEANLAQGTLEELGYQAIVTEQGGQAVVHIHIEQQDLTSALEIAQSYGGNLVEGIVGSEIDTLANAYNMHMTSGNVYDGVRIPAHTVNEDWQDLFASIDDSEIEVNTLSSDEDLNGFDAGIHI
ncbi:hypothetical protein NV379_10750 [Paenibacillus sp. N1-5-1-14]|uniref:hypothetical protein n=1 Tax=Paenibacillus radicibacter TaxID=2972488 RepID=UPI002158FD9D|nr:hypothetical protein [Paenibacillus radicibacter]MCR8643138.1 hypothetical protein [Paenibacillus radicibacter]